MMLLQDNAVEHECIEVNTLAPVSERGKDFLTVNPDGFVPAIDDDGFHLIESGAILAYLCNSREISRMYPQHAQQRARVDRWMHWYHTGSRNATTKLLIPFLSGKSADILAAGREEVGRHVQHIERHLSAIQDDPSRTFLAGGSVSIADLLIITDLDQLQPAAFNLFDFQPYPAVRAWMAAVADAVPSYMQSMATVVAFADKLGRSM